LDAVFFISLILTQILLLYLQAKLIMHQTDRCFYIIGWHLFHFIWIRGWRWCLSI